MCSLLILVHAVYPVKVQLELPRVSGLGFTVQSSALGSLCPPAAPPLVGSTVSVMAIVDFPLHALWKFGDV